MGKKPDILLTEKGNWSKARIQYTFQLLKYSKPENFLEKAKAYFKKVETEPLSDTKWREEMGSTGNNDSAGKLIDDLIKWDAMNKEGMEKNGASYNPVYSLNHDQLVKACNDSVVVQEMLPGFIDIINKEVPRRTVEREL